MVLSVRRESRCARLCALVALLAAGCFIASCGASDADEDRDQIEAAVRDVQQAFAAGDTGRVCRLLSKSARKHVEAMGHDLVRTQPCYIDLYMFSDGVTGDRGWRKRTARPVRDIEIGNGRATAKIDFGDGQTANLPLVEEEGKWKVDALYGGIPAERQRDNY